MIIEVNIDSNNRKTIIMIKCNNGSIHSFINGDKVIDFPNHFELYKGEWRLKRECNKDYNKLFFDALIPHKKEIFKYVQQYYRAFMRQKGTNDYPLFEL